MTRAALALLMTTAGSALLAGAASAQTTPPSAPSTPAAEGPQAAQPAGDAPKPVTAADQADRGATPTSGQPDEVRREGVTVYRPDFFAAARPQTALDMVARIPGFQIDSGNNVRGFAGTAGNLLIDGKRPASKSDSVDSVVSRIPAAQVDRIEVIRGGAPGIDMQGQSVVANIIVRAGNTSQQVVTVGNQTFLQGGNNLPSASYQVTRTMGPRSFDFTIGRGVNLDDSTGRGQRVRRDPSGAITSVETVGTEGDGAPYSARGSIKTPLMGGELRLNATASKSDFKDEDHFRQPGVRTDVIGVQDSRNGEVGANYTRPLTERLSMELVALQKLGKSEFISNFEQNANRQRFTSEAESGETIGRGVLRFKRSETLSFETGAEAAFNFRDGQTGLSVNGTVVPIPASNVRVEERRGEAFVTATWRPRPTLGVEAGSRFESSTISSSGDVENERSFFYPKPRFLLTWTPRPTDTVRLRIEREVGQLNFGDFVASANLTDDRVVAGNPEIEPDKTTVIEATVERRFWENGSISVGVSHEEITDAIDRLPIRARPNPDTDPTAPDIIFDAPGNIGEGTQDELDVNLTLPLGRFGISGGEFKANLEWVNSEVTDPTTGEARRISGQRPQNLQFEFRQDLPRFRLTYGAVYLNGFDETYYRFNEIFRVRLDRYFQAFVEYKPDPKTSFRVELANIGRFRLDRDREVFTGPRDEAPLAFTEQFNTQARQRLALRLRRTFS
jgi:hypothetical protein